MSSETKVYALTLTLLTGNKAPGGPGWYLIGHCGEGHIPPKRLTRTQAEEIARSIQGVTNFNAIEGEPTLFEVVSEGSTVAKEIIKHDLEEAERIATSVGILRKSLGEFE